MSAPTATNGAAGTSSGVITPPHNLDAEQSVLGAVLLSDRSLYALVIEEGLRGEDFYRERHAIIYEAMLALYNESEPVDVLTVTDRLRQMGKLQDVGGQAAVDELTGVVPAAGHARRYAQIVRENALLRRLLKTSYEIQESVLGHEAPPRELVELAEKSMLEVARDDRQQDFRAIEEVLHEELDKLHRLSLEGTSLTGTPSGFKDLDEITGGFQPGNLIIIAARPAMGKSALVCNIAENAAVDHNKPVALFSLEMAEAELAQRFVASQARIKGEELRKGRVSEQRWPKILSASERLAASPLWVDDSERRGHAGDSREGPQAAQPVRERARADHRRLPAADAHRQPLRQPRDRRRRAEPWSEDPGPRAGVPVIALSQLSRAVETRSPKVPQLSDLRESGNLEQDSDLVMFIYRDEYYDEESERPGEADLIIAKHRNGAVGKVTLTFQKEYPKFMNYAGERYAQ